MSDAEHQRMFQRIAGELCQVPEEIQQRQIALFCKVHPEYGKGIANLLSTMK